MKEACLAFAQHVADFAWQLMRPPLVIFPTIRTSLMHAQLHVDLHFLSHLGQADVQPGQDPVH